MHIIYCYFMLFSFLIYYIVTKIISLFIPRVFKKKKDIRGKKVLITGAGSGIGRQMAIEFSKYATCLILVDINKESLIETEKFLDIQSAVFIYDCDVTDYKKVYAMAKRVKEEVGDVDILVNNAGIVSGKYLMDLSEEQMVKTMEVNAFAHFWTCKAFLPAMMQKNCGHVVCIASITGKWGCPKLSDYCTSKFAAIGFAESVEMEMRELKLDGIKVTIVCPSVIGTGLFEGAKLKFFSILSPEYAANEIVLGILEEKEIIILPHIFYYLFLFKAIFPRWFTTKTCEIIGFIKAMEHFTGRQQNVGISRDEKD